MRTVLFWATTQQVVVNPYRPFGTTYWSHLHGSSPRTLTKGPIGFPETSVRIYHYLLRSSPEEHSSQEHLLLRPSGTVRLETVWRVRKKRDWNSENYVAEKMFRIQAGICAWNAELWLNSITLVGLLTKRTEQRGNWITIQHLCHGWRKPWKALTDFAGCVSFRMHADIFNRPGWTLATSPHLQLLYHQNTQMCST
jgi:hypothetical protein